MRSRAFGVVLRGFRILVFSVQCCSEGSFGFCSRWEFRSLGFAWGGVNP